MDRLNFFMIFLCLIVIESNFLTAHESESITFEPNESIATTTIKSQDNVSDYDMESNDDDNDEKASESAEEERQRSIADIELPLNNADRHAAFRKRAKPLKSIFMGIYRNYKSTYMGNKTIAEYKRTLHTKTNEQNDEKKSSTHEEELAKVENELPNHATAIETNDTDDDIRVDSTDMNKIQTDDTVESATKSTINQAKSENTKKKRKKQRGRKRNHRRKKHEKNHLNQAKKEMNIPDNTVYSYDFGPAVNMSLDMSNEIVKVHLDGENLRNIMQGRWLNDRSEGRGKKYEMITKVLPLFILPFLIQSAVVPFLVTKLKLLLMKSILVGKLAIFLLVISAIRNSNKGMQTYEVAPSYWAGEPSRRSELAAAASSAAYNGYRVEGKPTAWIN